ncbi:bifunctional metallophosphatase/5'-nucleotidase [Methylobacterium organophilum]|uniref:Mannosylglucosyl-3-phosphoglycerate phosphatase n=1 Tax=Methylobacterium organophilum TaxID=410 RepID=A0ABQ4T4H3_METOR|nr:bifunctional UDP-sugar hydrolase/5'-nucleotidase [Methylobacterium organophilum]GJE26138.1 Mannosylglucosyl-3-phosphoglycerate phosphatase [Methylobacterium organophilum]
MASSLNRRDLIGAGLASGLAVQSGPAQAQESARPTFSLLLVNDIYLMSAVEGRGGFARLNAVVKAERARGVPILYCHAGDCLSPSLMSGFDKGAHIVALHNLAPPDVFVPGNHEFDFGPKNFSERMAQARFPWFAANLRDAEGQKLPGGRDRTLFELGGVKVGLVGIALQSTPQKSQSGDLRFGPEIETLAREAAAVRAEGAEIVVGVCHTARPVDDAILRGRVVDILLSGHDHDLYLHDDGQGIVVESSHDALFVTAVDVTVTRDGKGKLSWRAGFRIHDTAQTVPDPETEALVRRYEGELSKELDVPIAMTAVPLDSRVATVRARESSFADLVADAVRARTGAEIGLMNGGGIRGDRLYPSGTVLTRRDVLTELPFGNTTVLVEITGNVLRAAIEHGYADLGRTSGRFLQISGLQVTLDPTSPPGNRLVSALVGGVPLQDEKRYRVAANNFMLDGGNGYGMLAEGRVLIGPTDGTLLADAVMTYLRERSPVTVEEGRILLR